MKIVIMRHGEAVASASSDRQRALTARGMQQAAAAGLCLSQQRLLFSKILASPYLRTQQTADQLLAHFPSCRKITFDLLEPESRPSEVVDAIGKFSEDTLLVVTHQPLIGDLVASLCSQRVAMSPASMALLDAPVVAAGCAELLWLRHAPLFERE